MAKGFKTLFATIILIFKFYKSNFINRSFEDILSFTSDITRTEIFLGTHYESYLNDRKNQTKINESKWGVFEKEYNFIYNYKSECIKLKISNRYISKLESRFYSIGVED